MEQEPFLQMGTSVDDVLGQAISLYRNGNMAQSEVLLRTLLERDPSHAIASHQLGLIAFARGDLTSAANCLRQAVSSNPNEPEYLNNLGVVLNAQGNHPLAREAFEGAISQDRNYLQAYSNLGALLKASCDDAAAIDVYRRALEIDPGCIEVRDNLDFVCNRVAPPWHFPMMADAARNQAYDAALCRVALGRRVLDIGTGAGLLAMMAARAGAVEVTTCEVVTAIAAVARKIIEHNGLSSHIVLHAKHSTQLQVGSDMAARADILVTETFASGILSESVLPTIEHARRHLLTTNAQVIPCRAAARGYLVGGPAIEAHLFAPRAASFDLANFDVFAPNKIGLHLDLFPHHVLSDDFELLSFDLTQLNFPPERRVLTVTAISDGRCVGAAQWLRLDLDSETTYENRPNIGAGPNGWMHVLYRFRDPIDLKAGETVRLLACHNRTAMTVALA
jgi:Tfp pilus assembly protein PilF